MRAYKKEKGGKDSEKSSPSHAHISLARDRSSKKWNRVGKDQQQIPKKNGSFLLSIDPFEGISFTCSLQRLSVAAAISVR